ncbi:hypothetical protein J437_LFUL002471 [Ladona fulva]|uniref:Uncharacterized protein n=1 Tax=Ladona fulva TaxID=123851 RepID=A0A8K0JSJ1_LADFU|nr:hypothetical protein J437_LFUL002471 [Ladona fulva]
MGSIRFAFLLLGAICLELWAPVAAKPAKIPSYIHVCKKNDPKVNDCIKKSIEDMRPQLIKGIPEINVPAFEPLVLPEVVVKSGNPGANFKATGKNVKVYGGGGFILDSVQADLNKNEFKASLTFPNLFFESAYEVDGQILVLPLKGKGPLTANATNVKGEILLKGEVKEKGGDKFLTFTSLNVKVKIDNYKIHLDGLFGGDKVLGDATNAALNEGNVDFIRAVTPVVEETTAAVLLKIANQIVESFTYDELFPEK